jgi:hypothetical protein
LLQVELLDIILDLLPISCHGWQVSTDSSLQRKGKQNDNDQTRAQSSWLKCQTPYGVCLLRRRLETGNKRGDTTEDKHDRKEEVV